MLFKADKITLRYDQFPHFALSNIHPRLINVFSALPDVQCPQYSNNAFIIMFDTKRMHRKSPAAPTMIKMIFPYILSAGINFLRPESCIMEWKC